MHPFTQILAEATKPAGATETSDLLILGGAMNLVIALWIWLLISYRRGGAAWLRRLGAFLEARTKIPGWAAVPGFGAVAAGLVTIVGATWDIGLHIDIGRDSGPFGTAAHYPLLIGLETLFLMGILAIAMAPRTVADSSPASVTIGGWRMPAGALLMTAASGFALVGFPADDVWHRIFGQDVTLWGPTHTMFIGGCVAAACGGVLLMIEGLQSAGINPFRGRHALVLGLGPLLAAIFLYFFTAIVHEYNWGVAQYRAMWHPYFLALGGALTMVMVRTLCGRGAALRTLIAWMPVQIGMGLAIEHLWDATPPAMPLFVAQALIVELLAIRGDWRSPVRFAVVAGLLLGTLGFAADYLWSQVGMPLPWEPAMVPEALAVSAVVAIAGAVLGALMATALRGRLDTVARPFVLAGAAAAVILALAVNNMIVHAPSGRTASIAASNERTVPMGHDGVPTRVADVTVRLSDPSLADDPEWAYVLGWQGGGRFLQHFRKSADGTLRATGVPVGGDWKSFVRIQNRRTMLAAPIRMPRDAEIEFAGYPAPANGAAAVTRPMVRDTKLLQIERKTGGPYWAWKPAFALVIGTDLMLFVLMGFVCVRIGRFAGRGGSDTEPLAAGEPRRRPAPSLARAGV